LTRLISVLPHYLHHIGKLHATGSQQDQGQSSTNGRRQEGCGVRGRKFLGVYVTLGRYDGVAISEFPNDESYFKFAFYIASLGFLSMETLKALPEEDFGKLISSLG